MLVVVVEKMRNLPFKLLGLTDQHKDFLYKYAQEHLGSKSRTKAILSLINDKMSEFIPTQKSIIESDKPSSNKKQRLQFSLKDSHFKILLERAKLTDSSPQHYIIRLVLNDLTDANILLGNEIEVLKKSNYELHKIGVNINQIAKAINSGEKEKIGVELDELYSEVSQHVEIVKNILSKNSKRY